MIRILLAFYFALCAMLMLVGTIGGPLRNPRSGHLDLVYLVIRHLIPAISAIIFGIAADVAARGRLTAKISGKAWTISACLLSLLFTAGFPFFYLRHGASAFWSMQEFFGIPTGLGIAGLMAFSFPRDHAQN
jgi:hypothetical protein